MILFFIEIKDLRSAEHIIYCSCSFAPFPRIILTLTNLAGACEREDPLVLR
jgi:hypothetical protein